MGTGESIARNQKLTRLPPLETDQHAPPPQWHFCRRRYCHSCRHIDAHHFSGWNKAYRKQGLHTVSGRGWPPPILCNSRLHQSGNLLHLIKLIVGFGRLSLWELLQPRHQLFLQVRQFLCLRVLCSRLRLRAFRLEWFWLNGRGANRCWCGLRFWFGFWFWLWFFLGLALRFRRRFWRVKRHQSACTTCGFAMTVASPVFHSPSIATRKTTCTGQQQREGRQ